MHPAIETLIDVIQAHPDFDGTIDTDEFPVDLVQEVYDALRRYGDDLGQWLPGAFGANDGNQTLVIMPPDDVDGWRVRYGGGRGDQEELDFGDLETPPVLQKLIIDVIGGNQHDARRFREILEQVYQEGREEVEQANKATDDWKVIPSRTSDDVVGKALMRYRKEK